jgi:uncharacterized protein GlcG (DUF336 family)
MAKVIDKKSISATLAQAMVEAAAKEAAAIAVPMAISVCDEAGHPKTFLRMDGAALLVVGVAIKKARTAASGEMPTDFWADYIKEHEPELAISIAHVEDMMIIGGGFPIMVDGQMVGAIGVSGGTVAEDTRCAKVALALLD